MSRLQFEVLRIVLAATNLQNAKAMDFIGYMRTSTLSLVVAEACKSLVCVVDFSRILVFSTINPLTVAV